MKKKSLQLLLVAVMVCLPLLKSWAQTEIRTADDLRNIKNGFDGSYVLMNDIDFSTVTDWVPIGVEDLPAGNTVNDDYNFTGTFDGQGHKLSNIKVNRPDLGFMSALFTKIGKAGASSVVVKNLVLENVDITGGNCTGGLSGTAFASSATAPITIQNISVTGKITGAGEVGGITGRINNNFPTTISDCSVNAIITGTDFILSPNPQGVASRTPTKVNVGGIVGAAFNGLDVTITNCLVQGQITAATAADPANELNQGGLIGHVNHANAVVNLNTSVVAAQLLGAGGRNAFWGNNVGTLPATGPGAATVKVNSCYALNTLGLTNQDGGDVATLSELHSQSFYEDLGWDFETVWQIKDGSEYPTLQGNNGTGISEAKAEQQLWTAAGANNSIDVTAFKPLFLTVYDLTGKTLFAAQVDNQVSIPAKQGIYVLKLKIAGKDTVQKLIVK